MYSGHNDGGINDYALQDVTDENVNDYAGIIKRLYNKDVNCNN